MTVSLQSSPVGIMRDDRTYHVEFPFQFPSGDAGLGSGGSQSITVELTPGIYALAWQSYGGASVQDATLPPAGRGYPAQPSQGALQAVLRWWPHGFHHWGYVSWSRNFGIVVSGKTGLSPNGDVVPMNFCYPYLYAGARKWKFLAYSSFTNDGMNPYSGNANAWSKHLGYDLRRRKDLVLYESNRYFTGSEDLAVYEISSGNTIPATRGAKIWQGTNGDRAAGLHNKFSAGVTQIQIPWLGVWWFIHIGESSNPADVKIFQWAPTASPLSSGSSTRASTDIPIPTDVKARANSASPNVASNLHFVVDQMGQRVIACQRDINNPFGIVSGLPRYPLLLWDVNPTTHAWTPISISPALNVSVGNTGAQSGKLCQTPLAYYGGSKFMYLDPADVGSAGYGFPLSFPGGDPTPTQVKKTGGLNTFEIFIPKASPPRTMTWTERQWSGPAAQEWNRHKHIEMCFNPVTNRMHTFGGDATGAGFPDPTLGAGSGYSNQSFSFTPENGGDMTLDSLACPAQLSINHPIRVDENGFQYRAASNDFWMMPGYSRGNGPVASGGWTNECGWATWDDWNAAGGGNDGFFRWSLSGGWTHAARNKAGIATMVPDTGFAGRTWIQGEDHCRRWYYDSGADVMVAAAMGYAGVNPDTGMQSESIQILNCTPSAGNYLFKKYSAHRCWNGLGGNTALLPDGRPYRDTVMGAIAMWNNDRACVDPVTGYVYVYNCATGDVFRIHTRSNFWTFEGLPAARVEWIFRIIPTGAGWNLTHMIWAKNALWIFTESGYNRLRVFSWANGETTATEHGPPEVPAYVVGRTIAKYTVGGDERICVVGNQTHQSWSSVFQSHLNSYYTITLS